MSKIITLTLNPAIDKVVEISGFAAGDDFTVEASSVYPAGKGINVARALSETDVPLVVLGLIGENELQLFGSIASENLTVDLVPVKGRTRNNITVYDPLNNAETHIREKGFAVSDADIAAVKKTLQAHIEPGDIVVFSGSLPVGMPKDIYNSLGSLCKELGATVALDSSGEALRYGLDCRPFFIKPNLKELEELLGRSLGTDAEIADAARHIANQYGVSLVVVSMASEGILAYKAGSEIYYRLKSNLTRDEFIPHSVGSGDSLVAGICRGMLNGDDFIDILSKGVAYGTANLFTDGPGIVNLTDIASLLSRIDVMEYSS